jgi:acetyltransferase-like isoleucine patch superfamily enzyme
VTKPVVIRDGAFIGAHTIVLKGVTIGERSVVGAGSVVTKDIPDGEIWAGNPARFIRKLDACSGGEGRGVS